MWCSAFSQDDSRETRSLLARHLPGVAVLAARIPVAVLLAEYKQSTEYITSVSDISKKIGRTETRDGAEDDGAQGKCIALTLTPLADFKLPLSLVAHMAKYRTAGFSMF